MATFGELWSAILPAALPEGVPTRAQLDRELGWVRVLKARVPAFDALDPGDVAIVPASALAAVAPSTADAAALIDGIADAGCAAILLIEGDGPDSTADGAAAAAVARGVPVLRVGRVDPNQLERSAIGVLLNRRAELEHQAGLLEASLEEVALGSGDVEAMIAAIAGLLGRAVVLEGGRGEVVAAHAPEGATGAASAVAAYLGGARSAALRVPLAARGRADPTDDADASRGAGSGGAARADASAVGSGSARRTDDASAGRTPSSGRLVLLGDRPASELERIVGPRIARLLALELARTDAVHRAAGTARRADVLPGDGPPWVMLLARQVPRDATALPIEAREELRSRLRGIVPARRMTLRGDAESLEVRLVLASGGADVVALAHRIAEVLARPVALSRPFSDAAGRPTAEAEARATLEAIEALPDGTTVAQADRLPAYRLLASLQSVPDGARNARALLEPLLKGSVDARRERLATLRAVLEQPGFNEAAAALGVHRNTLAYRIRRLEQLTGWRLADPELRLPLAVAVRLVQSGE